MTTHEFRPERYHIAIGSHEPALRIASGDTVRTTTVDARGHDARGVEVAPRGNPQTGPFYVDSAEPGDVLAVRLDRITPNRSRGWTRSMLAANVVDPEFVRELPDRGELTEWALDRQQQTASPSPAVPGLEALRVPLAGMIGCFGVAPPGGQAISTATSSTHGGNMDYRGFREGVVVYFPVFVPGALFHIGDGHAVQGDGEIVGTGIEISMDVEFTTWIHRKGKPIQWPRAEDDEFLMAVGNARPLDQALQHATAELTRWLMEDPGLDIRAASLLLGQCIRYDVGNVFDPAYTMVAKVEKRYLPRPGDR